MGFLSKIMKNPLVQMATPWALSAMMPWLRIPQMMSGINNPMLRSAIEQGLIGGGRALLMRDRHPGRAAMYAGLGSMPFSFMKASSAANLYNQELSALQDSPELFKTAGTQVGTGRFTPIKTVPPSMGFRTGGEEIMRDAFTTGPGYEDFMAQEQLTPWDVLKGSKKVATAAVPDIRDMRRILEEGPRQTAWDLNKDTIPYSIDAPEVDFYSKVGEGQRNLLGQTLEEGKEYTDWLPTIGSQTAGWIAGQPDADEKWEDRKKANRKMMAEMYGIPEHLLGGLMENPYDTSGFWKDGGIATLEMDAGGAVNGPGGPKDDVIDAKLSDGEFVMTAKAVENLGGGNRLAGAKQMYNMMNQLDPQSETVQESVIGV
jgi:hypothetical protein